jgi:hypothetical protein
MRRPGLTHGCSAEGMDGWMDGHQILVDGDAVCRLTQLRDVLLRHAVRCYSTVVTSVCLVSR